MCNFTSRDTKIMFGIMAVLALLALAAICGVGYGIYWLFT